MYMNFVHIDSKMNMDISKDKQNNQKLFLKLMLIKSRFIATLASNKIQMKVIYEL